MKAIITQHLTRKSWSNKMILNKTIIGTKNNIVNKVNDYITERISNKNFIPVKCFEVNIYNHYNKKVNNWNYKPTYR